MLLADTQLSLDTRLMLRLFNGAFSWHLEMLRRGQFLPAISLHGGTVGDLIASNSPSRSRTFAPNVNLERSVVATVAGVSKYLPCAVRVTLVILDERRKREWTRHYHVWRPNSVEDRLTHLIPGVIP